MTTQKRPWMVKLPAVLQERFDDVLKEKVAKGQINPKDRNKCTYKRVGLALAREPNVWKALKEAEFMEDDND